MAWVCKECGEEIVIREDNIHEDDFKINVQGKKGELVKSTGPFENHGWRYICKKCEKGTENYYEEIEQIAKWVD